MGLKGDLATLSTAEVLQWCGSGRKSGILEARQGKTIKQLHFKDGRIIFTASNDPREFLGQFLLGRGIITEEDLNLALNTQAETRVLLGRIFIIVGLIDEDQMAEVLKEKAEESIFDLFLWENGEFEFHDGKPPPRDIVVIDLDVERLVMEGAIRQEIWEKIRDAFPTDQTMFVVHEDKVPPAAWSDFEKQQIFEMINEERTLSEISLELHLPIFNAGQLLLEMLEQGYIGVQEEMELLLEETVEEEAPSPIEEQLERAQRAEEEGNPIEAWNLLRDILQEEPNHPLARPRLLEVESAALDALHEALPMNRIAELDVSMNELMQMNLTSEEGFLLSRIDGSWDIRSMLNISPLPEIEVLAILSRFEKLGVVKFR